MAIEIVRLKLQAPLFYVAVNGLLPFDNKEIKGEKLFCFELDLAQYSNFEPEKEKFFEKLVFAGEPVDKLNFQQSVKQDPAKKFLEVPRGNYLFFQKQGILAREELAVIAAEMQMEGLWQRLKPGNNLYLRYLFEDEKWVTQLLRMTNV